jgi:hypothetical protein
MAPTLRVKAPNKTTVKAMKDAENRKGKRFRSAAALFKHLNI